jgi:septal ring factor EnvC (AmiA/AmiB activator)
MPKVQRTPPASPSKAANIQSQSESDSSSIDKQEPSRKVTTRSKRLRMESSPHGPECDQTNFTEFKQELLSMFSTWRVEQSGTLSKLVADVAALKTQCSEIHKSNLEIEASITFINVQFEEMKERITKLEIERNQNRDCLISLEKQLEELKQLSRSSSIEVRNGVI